jgi:hypothetical protein
MNRDSVFSNKRGGNVANPEEIMIDTRKRPLNQVLKSTTKKKKLPSFDYIPLQQRVKSKSKISLQYMN